MKKMNKKGFTLIELLAVIVVLAIIMVIATQQINKTIKKSRADSFYDSVQMIEKNANMLCAQNDKLSVSELADMSEIDHNGETVNDEDYGISISGNQVTVTAKGQFGNVTLTNYYSTDGKSGTKKIKSGYTVSGNAMTFTADCSTTTSTSGQ